MIQSTSALRKRVGVSLDALKSAADTQRALLRYELGRREEIHGCNLEEIRHLWGVLDGIRHARRALLCIAKVVDDFPSAKEMLVGLSNDPLEVDRLDSPSFYLGRLSSHASTVRTLLSLFDGVDPFECCSPN